MCVLLCVQASQADRIRREIDAFTARVQQHKASFAAHVLFKHSTGCAAAYPMLDAAAADLVKLSKECKHFTELSSVFELCAAVVPVTEAIKELYEQLVAVKDAWDCNMLCDVQFQVRKLLQASYVCCIAAYSFAKSGLWSRRPFCPPMVRTATGGPHNSTTPPHPLLGCPTSTGRTRSKPCMV